MRLRWLASPREAVHWIGVAVQGVMLGIATLSGPSCALGVGWGATFALQRSHLGQSLKAAVPREAAASFEAVQDALGGLGRLAAPLVLAPLLVDGCELQTAQALAGIQVGLYVAVVICWARWAAKPKTLT